MNAIEVKTVKAGKLQRNAKYTKDIISTTVFLRHSEDRITVSNGVQVEIYIYDNDTLIFSGSKGDLFRLLNKQSNENNY